VDTAYADAPRRKRHRGGQNLYVCNGGTIAEQRTYDELIQQEKSLLVGMGAITSSTPTGTPRATSSAEEGGEGESKDKGCRDTDREDQRSKIPRHFRKLNAALSALLKGAVHVSSAKFLQYKVEISPAAHSQDTWQSYASLDSCIRL
jgi:hypothetical protein